MKKKILYILLFAICFSFLLFTSVQASNNKQDIFRSVTDTEQSDGSHKINYRIYNSSGKCEGSVNIPASYYADDMHFYIEHRNDNTIRLNYIEGNYSNCRFWYYEAIEY